MNISIIVPVWNEETRLKTCLDQLLKYASAEGALAEIIVCADGCTDGTLSIANQYAQESRRVKVAYWPERLGKGGGILNGLKLVSGDVVAITDVDLSAPPTEIAKLVGPFGSGSADLVLGSRNLRDSIIVERPPWYRTLLGRAFNFFFRALFHASFHDTQCGFKAIKTGAFRDLSEDLIIEGYGFDIDLIVKALERGYRILEVPIVWGYRKGSRVRLFHDIVSMARSLAIVWLESKKKNLTATDERSMKNFYDNVPGYTYHRATRSWFLPRAIWHRRKNRQVVECLAKDARVLDAGCGSGATVEALVPQAEVYGMDIGKGFVRFCQETYGKVGKSGFVLADVRHIPFCTGIFDSVICSEVIEHIHSRDVAIAEFYRVLRPAGLLILTTPNLSIRWSLLEAVWTRVRRRMIEIGHRSFSGRQLEYLLSSAGFRVLSRKTILFGCLCYFLAQKENGSHDTLAKPVELPKQTTLQGSDGRMPETVTSGFYMKTAVYGNLAGMNDSWHFYSWTDKNGNGFVEDYEVNATPINHGN